MSLSTALSGVRVLEVGYGLSGSYATLMLAGLGADVCRVPVAGARPPRTAAQVAYFDRGKSVVDDEGAIDRLARSAHLIVTDMSPAELRERGLPTNEDDLESRLPGAVHVAITAMGLTGPHAEWAMDDITEWAAGGLGAMTRGFETSNGVSFTPVLPPDHQPELLGGIAGAIGAFVGLREARAAGRAVLVDVSRVEVQASMSHSSFPAFIYSNEVMGAKGSMLAQYGLVIEAADGPVYLRTVEDSQWLALAAWMGVPDEVANERVGGLLLHHRDLPAVRAIVEPWAAQFTARQLVEEGQARRIPFAEPSTAQMVLASAQLAHREAWRSVDVDGRDGRAPAVPLLEPAERSAPQARTAEEMASRWNS